MFRKQLKSLENWKNRKVHKPLVLRGARQVGKTYLVRDFAAKHFQNLIEINLDETPNKADIFQYDDIDTILRYLALDAGTAIIPGETLIFLDEIQRFPEIFAKLRYFFERKPDLHIIAAGSLLDFILAQQDFSMPVGRIEYMFIGPMDFMEFLHGIEEGPLAEFLENYTFPEKIPPSIHNKLVELTRLYMMIGGMPAAVRSLKEDPSLNLSQRELSSILLTYRDDFSKYGKKTDPYLLQKILDRVPPLIGTKVKFTEISRDHKSAELKNCLTLLEMARLLHFVFHSSGNGTPLKSEVKPRDFKLLFLDIGLMMRSLGLSLLELRNDQILLANNGSLAEQFVGQQLLHALPEYENPEIFYWQRQKAGTSSELDYLIQNRGQIVPVEVKAGKTGSLKSLQVFATLKKSNLAIRFNLDNPSITNIKSAIPSMAPHKFDLISLPLYFAPRVYSILDQYADEKLP